MKILIVSDTHGSLHNFDTVIEREKEIDMLLHLGDGVNPIKSGTFWGSQYVVKKIKKSVDIFILALYNTKCVTKMGAKKEHRGVAQLG